jgi:hypothetical protein
VPSFVLGASNSQTFGLSDNSWAKISSCAAVAPWLLPVALFMSSVEPYFGQVLGLLLQAWSLVDLLVAS